MAMALDGVRDVAAAFFSWWFRELEALWRPLLKLLQRDTPTLTITACDEDWIVRLHNRGRVEDLGRIVVSTEPSIGKKALADIVRRAKLRHSELKVLIPQHQALRKILDMPAVAEPDLRHALSFEIDRQTPFQPEDVYFAYRILARRPDTKRVTVELTTVPRASVEEVVSRLQAWGIQPSGVDVSVGDALEGIGINLLKGSDQESSKKRSPLEVAAALLLILLLAAAFYIPVRQLGALDESLAAQVAKEQEAAKRTTSMRSELEQTIKAARLLDERKKTVPNSLLVLNELTKAIPDNTYLLTFVQNNKEVKISGYSAAAAELISAIDAVPIFEKPAFTSSIVRDQNQKLERFEILFEVDTSGAEAQ